MQPRSLQQILSELDATYNPQIDLVRQQQAAIPGQVAEEQKGLQAKQDQAFGDILNGARRRGLGFSGIPLGEQAKYTATDYLPALARLQQSGRDQAMSLEQAILGIQERKNQFGQSIFQQEQDRAEQARQFNAKLSAERQPDYTGLFGQGNTQQQQAPSQSNALKQRAQSDVGNLLTKDQNRIRQEYMAIKKSAGFGNTYDQLKLQLIEYYHPELRSTGSNTVPLGRANPTTVPLTVGNAAPTLGVTVANPGRLALR